MTLDQSKGPFNSLVSNSGQKWMLRDRLKFVEQRSRDFMSQR